jgi:hypothetical protein
MTRKKVLWLGYRGDIFNQWLVGFCGCTNHGYGGLTIFAWKSRLGLCLSLVTLEAAKTSEGSLSVGVEKLI